MSWWKDGGKENKPGPAAAPAPKPRADVPSASPPRPEPVPPPQPPPRLKDREPVATPATEETAIGAGMVIEGKIQGSTDLRIAGTFKGDLVLQGTLTVDPGGLVIGNVSAKSVVLAGEIRGNIDAAARVAILGSGILRGDLKAALFLAEAGAQMAGQAEFGGVSGRG